MPFQPEALTQACLKDLAKSLKKGAYEVIGHPVKLSQAQELLARALGHPNWSAAITAAPTTADDGRARADTRWPPLIATSARRFEKALNDRLDLPWGRFEGGGYQLLKDEVLSHDGLLTMWIWMALPAIPQGFVLKQTQFSLTGWVLAAVEASAQQQQECLDAVCLLLTRLASQVEHTPYEVLPMLEKHKEALSNPHSYDATNP